MNEAIIPIVAGLVSIPVAAKVSLARARKERSPLKKLLGRESYEEVKERVKEKYQVDLDKDVDFIERKDIKPSVASIMEERGFISVYSFNLRNGQTLDMIHKYAPNKDGNLTSSDKVIHGAKVQRYVKEILGIDQVPDVISDDPRLGNVSFFYKDAVRAKEQDSDRKIETVKTTLDVLVDINHKFDKTKSNQLGLKSAKPSEVLRRHGMEEKFLEIYSRVVDPRLIADVTLSHNDLHLDNVLQEDQEVVIDWDKSTLQSTFYDVDTLFRSAGLNSSSSSSVRNSLVENLIDKITDNKNDKELRHEEYNLVRFDNDLRYALLIEKFLKSHQPEDQDQEEAFRRLDLHASYYFTRANNTLEELASRNKEFETLRAEYQEFIKRNNKGSILESQAYSSMESEENPDLNSFEMVKKLWRAPSDSQLQERINNYEKRLIFQKGRFSTLANAVIFGNSVVWAAAGALTPYIHPDARSSFANMCTVGALATLGVLLSPLSGLTKDNDDRAYDLKYAQD